MINIPHESVPDTKAYLKRLGLENETVSLTPEFLDKIVRAHLTHIPFENLDSYYTRTVRDISAETVYKRIVDEGRGGYCFELNGILCAFLHSLGFDAYSVIVSISNENDPLPPPAHRSVICVIDGKKYYCDVGFGGRVPFGAMPMNGELFDGYYFERGEVYSRICNEDGTPFVQFKDVPAAYFEFLSLNYYVVNPDNAYFKVNCIANKRTEDGGVVSMFNDTLKIRDGGGCDIIHIENEDHRKELLREYYDINLS